MASPAVTVRVPAKVNLQLAVGPLGLDGYHPLATVFHAVSLFDEVTAEPLPAGMGIKLTAAGEDVSGVPLGRENLASRAAAALADRLGVGADVALRIRKGIPVAGGMAGGSADAAGALLACARLWGGADDQVLHEVATDLGSDVPFLLQGGTAVGTGRGEVLAPVSAGGSFDWVFATAFRGLSTPEVYGRYDELAAAAGEQPPAPRIDQRLLAAVSAGDAPALGAALQNDLQPAAVSLRPSLQALLDAGLAAGALGAVVSGSGPTVAFLVDGDEGAMALVMALSPSGLCQALRRARGPVPGARVVSDAG